MDDAYTIAHLPKGAIVQDAGEGQIKVLMPDGSTEFISVVLVDNPLAPFKVVKTVFPADMKIEVSVANARKADDTTK